MTASAFSAWTSAALTTSSGRLGRGRSGLESFQKSRAAARAEADAVATAATTVEAIASGGDYLASRSCSSPTDATSQAAIPSATIVRKRARAGDSCASDRMAPRSPVGGKVVIPGSFVRRA